MKNRFYIATSIAYVNAPAHIGFGLELVQADVLARYHRILGEDVLFLTGTDEHGVKIAKAAKEAGKSPEDFVNEVSSKFRDLTKVLNISNDDFIRTTDKDRHWPVVQKLWLKLKENGDIYKKKYQGLYCVGCESFITKKDLINGKCAIHQKEPEKIDEENYFFKLSRYSKEIEELISKDEVRIIPDQRKNEMLNFIRQGLEDVSFSRTRKDLKWGIQVPGDETQTVYVWADALLNYISALDYPSAKFKKFWPADVHCLGKDILRFHATIFLGMLLSLKLALPKVIFVHGFITVAGQKISKSLGNVIDPLELVKKYGADAVRYFLLREIPPTGDGDFTYEKFDQRYDSDLASGLGNLVARVVTLANKSEARSTKSETNSNFQILKIKKRVNKATEEFRFNDALIAIWELIGFCDEYVEKQRPWEESKNQKKVIGYLLSTIGSIAEMLEPFLPETSGKILKQLKILESEALFPRLTII